MDSFQRTIWTFYRAHRRELPWRHTFDPYRILVSEIMLQQTQVERVRAFYDPFLKKFPTPAALARAPLSSVLRAWQGLGYNRRAKFLRAATQAMVKEHAGRVPANEAALVALPGIGRNTAGAVLAFAFDTPVVFIETNIRRAFIHHFFPERKSVDDKKLLPLIEKELDRARPREWYYALMDYGAMLGRDVKLVNPNRRSRGYKKQAAFEGSDRKMRGEIIRLLLKEKTMERSALKRALKASSPQFKKVLAALEKEKMVKVAGDILRLA